MIDTPDTFSHCPESSATPSLPISTEIQKIRDICAEILNEGKEISVWNTTIMFHSRSITINGKEIPLTSAEIKLFIFLCISGSGWAQMQHMYYHMKGGTPIAYKNAYENTSTDIRASVKKAIESLNKKIFWPRQKIFWFIERQDGWRIHQNLNIKKPNHVTSSNIRKILENSDFTDTQIQIIDALRTKELHKDEILTSTKLSGDSSEEEVFGIISGETHQGIKFYKKLEKLWYKVVVFQGEFFRIVKTI